MVTAGLDLRMKDSMNAYRPQRGRTSIVLCDIFEVVPCLVTHSAGQDLGSFSVSLRKRQSRETIVRPRWGRGVGIDHIHRGSRPAVMHM